MRKILNWVAVISAVAAAVIIALVSAAFAVFAALAPAIGAAWAAAVVAAIAAVLAGAGGLLHALGSGERRRPEPEPSLSDKLMTIARERPMLAAGAALAAGMVALKNPKLAAGLASAFMAGKAADRPEHPRRRW